MKNVMSRFERIASMDKTSNFIKYSPTPKDVTLRNESRLNRSARIFVDKVSKIINDNLFIDHEREKAYSILVSMANDVRFHYGEEEVARNIIESKKDGFNLYFEDEKGIFARDSRKTREKIKLLRTVNTTWIRFLEMVASLNVPGDTRRSEKFISKVEELMIKKGIVDKEILAKRKKKVDDNSDTIPLNKTEWEWGKVPYRLKLDDGFISSIGSIPISDLERLFSKFKNEKMVNDYKKKIEELYPKAKSTDDTI